MSARLTGGKWLASALATLLLVAGLSTTSFADMRIVHESEGERTEILIKEGRIVWHLDAEDWLLIDCAREEVTIVAPPRYWEGPVAELGTALKEQQERLLQDLPAGPGMEGLFGSIGFGTSKTTRVRVTQLEDDTIAGYRATRRQDGPLHPRRR